MQVEITSVVSLPRNDRV